MSDLWLKTMCESWEKTTNLFRHEFWHQIEKLLHFEDPELRLLPFLISIFLWYRLFQRQCPRLGLCLHLRPYLFENLIEIIPYLHLDLSKPVLSSNFAFGELKGRMTFQHCQRPQLRSKTGISLIIGLAHWTRVVWLSRLVLCLFKSVETYLWNLHFRLLVKILILV